MQGNFEQLVKERRSASNFLENSPITRRELDEIFDLVKYGPSAFNLQHTNYIVVTNPKIKEQIYHAALKQYKVKSSSAVIIVLGDKKAHEKASDIYKGLMQLGIYSEQEYKYRVNDTITFYESKGEEFQKEDAIRNSSLSAMLFMLAAKAKGWDACPMIGFEPDRVREILNIKDNYEIVMMVTIGKEKVSSRKPRGYRKPISEFVQYIE